MKRFLLLTTILVQVLFFITCTSVKTIVINVQKPAEITLPKSIENIGVVNNAIPQPPKFGHYQLKYSEKGEQILDEITLPADSNCILLSEALFKEMDRVNYFKNISLYEYPLREDLAFQENRRVDSIDVIDLARIMDVDAILSLDRFIVSSASYSQPLSFDAESRYLGMKADAVFRIYSKEGNPISKSLSFQDSLYWESVYSNDRVISDDGGLPNREDAVKAIIGYVAEKISQSLVPHWFGEYRTYYGDVKEAVKKAEADKWGEALEVWKKAYESEQKNIRKKARIAYNIALAYEVSDNIYEALSWAQKSVKLFTESAETSIDANNKKTAESYYNVLMERFKEFKLLDMQQRDYTE